MNERKLPLLTAPKGVRKFLFLASHGLRTPLTSIRWGASQLRNGHHGTLNGGQDALCREIHISAKELARALSSMFLLTKLDEGAYEPHREPIDICTILSRITASIFVEEERGILCTTDCPQGLSVQSDAELCSVLLTNICGACFDAIDPSTFPKVHIAVMEREHMVRVQLESRLHFVYLRVANHDSIPHSDQERVIGGTAGLLLSMSTELVKYLHGTIDVTELEDGSHRIALELPLRSA